MACEAVDEDDVATSGCDILGIPSKNKQRAVNGSGESLDGQRGLRAVARIPRSAQQNPNAVDARTDL